MWGTRANGDRYPPGWTPFQVEDWEGEHLIRGGMAMEVEPPYVAPPPPLASPAQIAVLPEEDEEAAPDGPVENFAPLPPAPPAPADPKQSWVDYAVSQGMDPDTAAKMTKADLQSRFGPRL